jgi:hypothetical protein
MADAFSGNIYGVKFDLQTFYLTCSDKTMITENKMDVSLASSH